MYRPELLAPAGDLSRLKIAILYGADAVFIGGKVFSLRAKANNFSLEDIKEGVNFAHEHKAKVYVTVNIIPEEEDFKELDEYLQYLDKINIDAIIISSITVLLRAKALNCKFEIHMSTQLSIANKKAIEFYKELGATRFVLARELNIEQIKNIKKDTNLPIEVFIHGGMCSSYSGRCNLSNFMSNRDANKGGCAHSCRWIYNLYENNKPVDDNEFTLASFDLMAINYLPELLEAKVDSFKIEGRMKSAYYIASVVRIYRLIIDDYLKYHTIDKNKLNQYKKEILKVENRSLSSVFLNKNLVHEGILLDNGKDMPCQTFVGYVLEDSNKDNYVLVQQRNYFTKDSKIEIIGPNNFLKEAKILDMLDEDNNPVEIANHATQLLKIKLPFKVVKDSFIRLK